jgi:hypothetical protein
MNYLRRWLLPGKIGRPQETKTITANEVRPPQLAASSFSFHCGGSPSLTTVSPLRFRNAKKRPQLGGRTEAAISSNAFRRYASGRKSPSRPSIIRSKQLCCPYSPF